MNETSRWSVGKPWNTVVLAMPITHVQLIIPKNLASNTWFIFYMVLVALIGWETQLDCVDKIWLLQQVVVAALYGKLCQIWLLQQYFSVEFTNAHLRKFLAKPISYLSVKIPHNKTKYQVRFIMGQDNRNTAFRK